MAVGLRLKFEGGTQEQYDAVHSHMKVDQNPPPGLIFHSAGPIDAGWGVIDVWESRQAFDAFIGGRLQPARGAREQLDAEMRLGRRDVLADGRLGYAELAGHGGEVAGLAGADESREGGDTVHGPKPRAIINSKSA